jgi:Tol biopolymer transport system component
MDADGSNRDQLTFAGSSVDDSTWSPDGNRIAFDLIANNAQSIFSIEPDGSNLLRLTTRPRENNREPSYSPSGNKIVYKGVTTPGGDDQALFVIPAGGGSPEQLTAARASGSDADPYWGPTP